MSQNVNVNVVNVIGSNSPTSDSCGCGGCLAMLLVIGAVGWAVSFYSDQPAQPPAPTVNEPAALNAATMPAGPRVPDLKDKLDALQKDLANARHDLDAVSRAVLDDLRQTPQYQAVSKDLAYWTSEDQTTNATHRHAKEFAGQQRRRFAAQIQRMETDALDSSPAVQRLKAKLAGFRKGVEDTRQQIARQEEQKPEHE